MRVVIALVLVGLAAPAASASPRHRVVSMMRRAPVARVSREANPVVTRARAIRHRAEPAKLARRPGSVAASVRPEIDEFTMPTVWSDLRLKVGEMLPSGGTDRSVQYTLMPMTITGASETTAPALGISGTF